MLPVIVLNADGSAYDLTDKSVVFSENKNGGKVIIDDGTGTDSGTIKITDAKAGKFEYTLQKQVYVESGTCWFEIKTGDTVVDTTKNFYFDVDKDAAIQPLNDSYISRVQALEDHLQGVTQKAEQSITSVSNDLTSTSNKAKQDAINAINDAKNNATTTLNNLNKQYSDYQTKYNSLESQWDAQKKKIQQDADAQRASIKTTDDKARTDAINQINSARDAAIKTANDNFNKKLTDLQNDYNSWKTKTVNDFDAKVKQINDSISTQNSNMSDVSKKLTDTQTQMSNLLKQFNNVNFAQYAKQTDIYTKDQIDSKIAAAGKVKTVDGKQPDSNGNINTDHYTKAETDTKIDAKKIIHKFNSPQEAYDWSKTNDGIAIYDMDDGPSQAVIGDKTVTISTLKQALDSLTTQVGNSATKTDLSSLQTTVNGKADNSKVTTLQNQINTINALKFTVLHGTAASNSTKQYTGVSALANNNWLVDQEVVKDIITQLNSANDKIATANSQISALNTKVASAKKEWTGTTAQYDALTTKDANTIYYMTDS